MRWDLPLAPFGRVCLALALVGLGELSFLFGDIVIGRAPPWPEALPGRLVWVVVSGSLLIVAGATLFLGKPARGPLLLAALMVFVWALLRHVPIVASHRLLDGSWTAMGKAVVFVGGLCAVAGSLPGAPPGAGQRRFLWLGRICLGYFMIQSGIQHFLFLSFVATLVPAWMPGQELWAGFAGIALIAGGAGLLFPPTARLAAQLSGLMIFSWFLILHIPRALGATGTAAIRNEWTAVFEALAFSALAFALVTSSGPASPAPTRSAA